MYSLVVLSRCFLFHPRRNVEFERITETRRWGKSEHNIHPSLLRFVLLRPPAAYLSRSHSSILSSALASSVVSSISFSLSLSPSCRHREPVIRTHARTHARTERYSHTHTHAHSTRAISRYIRCTRAISRFSLSTYYERVNLFAMQIPSDRR